MGPSTTTADRSAKRDTQDIHILVEGKLSKVTSSHVDILQILRQKIH